MFENEVIDGYMHCIMPNFKFNAHVCKNSLADVSKEYCVELMFFEGKLGGFLMIRV